MRRKIVDTNVLGKSNVKRFETENTKPAFALKPVRHDDDDLGRDDDGVGDLGRDGDDDKYKANTKTTLPKSNTAHKHSNIENFISILQI